MMCVEVHVYCLICANGIYSLAVLTLKNLIPLLKKVRQLWNKQYDDGEIDEGMFGLLGVPQSKQQEILVQCGPDEDKAMIMCTEWWLEHTTDRSWRQVIYCLDFVEETEIADGLRQYAEPPAGITQGIVTCIRRSPL